MAEVLAAPAQQHKHTPSPLPSSCQALPPQPQQTTHKMTSASPTTTTTTTTSSSSSQLQPPSARNRMSQYSLTTGSRPTSNTFPPLQSSLSYALVRDFAYPSYHPMHFGGSPEEPSGASTPGSDWNAGRRASDSAEGSAMGGRGAGPWGGDGAMYGDPDQDMEPLPSTAFGSANPEEWGEDETSFKMSKHRKSRSFDDVPNYERGRRRESNRASRGEDGLYQGGVAQLDQAGRDALRQSRGAAGPSSENGGARRESHVAVATLQSRSFHTSQSIRPDSDLPLDAEPSLHHSPQRESMGPEDEELFAGPSLALYSFEPENENELRLIEGQVILVSYRHGQGWLVAQNPDTGDQGLVPEQYVRLLRDIEGWDEERGQFIDEDPFASQGEDTETTEMGTLTGVRGAMETDDTGREGLS